jgi:hypothetical protein
MPISAPATHLRARILTIKGSIPCGLGKDRPPRRIGSYCRAFWNYRQLWFIERSNYLDIRVDELARGECKAFA